jgi:hypothetical protein
MEQNIINIINQICEIEKKAGESKIERNLRRIKENLQEMGYTYYQPIHEKYDETRLDCDADIINNDGEGLTITEVIKPVIYKKEEDRNLMVQKAVVIVESFNANYSPD